MYYHSSPIDTLNSSADNRGKRTENASILQNFLEEEGGGEGGHPKNAFYWQGNESIKLIFHKTSNQKPMQPHFRQ